MNIQSLLESSNQYKVIADDAKKLSKKWIKSGLLEGINNENDRNTLSMLLENQAKQLVTEASATGGAAGTTGAGYSAEGWNGVALPLVRRVFGEIAAKEFVSVQPMNLPSGLVFYLDFKYGTNDVHFTSGGSLYGANPVTNVTDITSESLYGPGQFGYSLNNFSASITAVTGALATWADFNFDSDFSASAASSQYRKVSVPLPTVSDQNAIRAFFISGSFISGSGGANTRIGGITVATLSSTTQGFTTVTNNTASFLVTASAIVTTGTSIASGSADPTQTLTLFYTVDNSLNTSGFRGDFEDTSTGGGAGTQGGNGGYPSNLSNTTISIPEINVQLKSEAIVAKTRKLKAQWTPEFAQDLNAYHSVDAEAELTGILSQYISMEIDLELLDMLIQNAFTVDAWSAVNNTTVTVNNNVLSANPSVLTSGYYNTQGGWFQTLGTKLQKVSNKIHQLTLRGGANFLVMSPTVATIIESIPGFAADGTGEKLEYNFGIQKIGSLNSRYKVYKNPYMTENVILMGYKGAQFLECGAVFAPYVPLIMTPLLYDPSTFTPRKGLMTRYAKKMIRPDYYGKIYVSGLNTI
jgi:hypothetical protein